MEGGRVQVNGTVALDGIASVNHTQENRVLPQAEILAKAEAVPRFFFIEGGLRANQTSADPFAARPEPGTNTSNTFTALQAHITPSIESQIDPNTRYTLRSSNSITRETGAPGGSGASSGEGYFGRHTAFIEHDPRPFGWKLEAERSETRYRNELQNITDDIVRASGNFAFTDWTVGPRVGRERTTLQPSDPWHTIYGAQVHWEPSPRTALSAFVEKRFFGNAWLLEFDNRQPYLAWNVTTSRTLDTTPQALFDLPATGDVAGLLDAIFSTQIPDPLARERFVRDMLARGVPSSSLHPLTIYAQRASIVQSSSARVALIGVRNTLTLAAYRSRTEDATTQGSPVLTGERLFNNVQVGASATLSHRLTPTIAFSGALEWSRVRAIDTPEESIQRTARLRVEMQATPRTVGFAGLRFRNLDSNTEGEAKESAVFVGVDHRF
jgi:uncharacterized protein (PEP-CTERM system associated)